MSVRIWRRGSWRRWSREGFSGIAGWYAQPAKLQRVSRPIFYVPTWVSPYVNLGAYRSSWIGGAEPTWGD
jgi:hypothetical protein